MRKPQTHQLPISAIKQRLGFGRKFKKTLREIRMNIASRNLNTKRNHESGTEKHQTRTKLKQSLHTKTIFQTTDQDFAIKNAKITPQIVSLRTEERRKL